MLSSKFMNEKQKGVEGTQVSLSSQQPHILKSYFRAKITGKDGIVDTN